MAKKLSERPPLTPLKKRLLFGSLFISWVLLTAVQWRMFSTGAATSPFETLVAFGLININIIALLLLLFLTMRNLTKLLFERKHGILGARLKTKLVLAFLATTVIPTLILFLASASFLGMSVDRWFSTRVDQSLENAIEVARSYYGSEEKQVAWAGRAMRDYLERRAVNPLEADELEEAIRAEMEPLQIDAVHLIYEGGALMDFIPEEGLAPPPMNPDSPEVAAAFAEGAETTIVLKGAGGDFLRTIVPVHAGELVEGVLLADRYIPVWTIKRLEEIRSGFEEYRQMELLREPIKASYIFPLLLVSLLIMFAAIWFGFYLARTITEPIGALADATHRVAVGDLDFQVEVKAGDEMSKLVDSFNMMTRDLRESRRSEEVAQEDLRKSNVELEERRLYMETVLSRITAGVVGTDTLGRITTINTAAKKMLGLSGEVEGKAFRQLFPDELKKQVDEIMAAKRRERTDILHRHIQIYTEGMQRTVMVHLTTLRDEAANITGFVVVLNDLTDLVKAQRAQAWREVARRVAHEIKNPLTPIQLSAQRLRRKYRDLLEEAEGEVLDEATSTIVTQVEGLKYMVNEFSRFAKMPDSRPGPADFNDTIEDVLGLYRPSHPEISFDVRLGKGIPTVEVDTEQVKRAVVNLLDNAISAMESVDHRHIEITTEHDPNRQVVKLVIADSGPGLSRTAREKLFEPYFSTKRSGTGLGLAIVKSIMADHRGYVRAVDNIPQGTRFILEFPLPGAEA
ncbi:MAG: PAS domain-containing sensor histidine kinase [Deltaproteobacteria bacterium]|nr:MAG: PAS domain-containing sensor histidine kinase [Deltaproteobacteria bacterium]